MFMTIHWLVDNSPSYCKPCAFIATERKCHDCTSDDLTNLYSCTHPSKRFSVQLSVCTKLSLLDKEEPAGPKCTPSTPTTNIPPTHPPPRHTLPPLLCLPLPLTLCPSLITHMPKHLPSGQLSAWVVESDRLWGEFTFLSVLRLPSKPFTLNKASAYPTWKSAS